MNGSSAKIYPFTHEWSVGKSLYYNGQLVGKTNTIYFSATYFPIIWISRAAKNLLKQRSCDHTGTNLFLEAGRRARQNPNSYWPPPPHQKKRAPPPPPVSPARPQPKQRRRPPSSPAHPRPPSRPLTRGPLQLQCRHLPLSHSATARPRMRAPQPALACAPPGPPSFARPPSAPCRAPLP